MKKIGKFLIVLIILIGVLVLAKNIIAQAVIVNGVKAITGLQLEVRSVNVGMLRTFRVDQMKLMNPAGFNEKVMAELPEIYADYNIGEFFKGKVHLRELRIDLKELTVITNEKGEVNIKSMKAFLPKQGGGKPPQVQIDNLNLKVGKLIYKGYRSGKPETREFNVNINENFKNITDPNALVSLILVKALSKTSIAGLANIDLGGLKDEVSKAVSSQAQTGLQDFENKAKDTLHNLFNPK